MMDLDEGCLFIPWFCLWLLLWLWLWQYKSGKTEPLKFSCIPGYSIVNMRHEGKQKKSLRAWQPDSLTALSARL